MRLKPFIRVCASCGAKQRKQELVMFKKSDGKVVLGNHITDGKSIYLCKECAQKLDDPKTQGRAFKMKLSSESIEKLKNELKEF